MSKGPIKEVTDTYSGERREEYAKMLEELAQELRERKDFPEGVFVAVSWRDGDVGKRYECEPTFSASSHPEDVPTLTFNLWFSSLGTSHALGTWPLAWMHLSN